VTGEQGAERFDVTAPVKTYTGNNEAVLASWLADIKTAIQDVRTAVQINTDADIRARWLADIEAAIQTALAETATPVRATYDAATMKLTFAGIDTTNSLTIWPGSQSGGTNPTTPNTVEGTVAGTGATYIETIKGGLSSNLYTLNDNWGTLVIDDRTTASGGNEFKDANSTLDFSNVATGIDVTFFAGGRIVVSSGSDRLSAFNIANLIGSQGNDTFTVMDGAEFPGLLTGGPNGSAGVNTLDLSDIDGLLQVDLPADDVTDGTVFERIALTGGDDLFGGVRNIDNVVGAFAKDVSLFDETSQQILGNAGNNNLTGNDGQDIIDGASGNDTLQGADEDDVLTGGPGSDTLDGGSGDDSLLGEDDNDELRGGVGDDSLEGGLGEDRLFGDSGNDTLDGGEADDEVSGGQGNDTLSGGPGDDTLKGGDDDDTYQFSGTWGQDIVVELPSNGSEDTLDFSAITVGLTHLFNEGELVSGTGTFAPTRTNFGKLTDPSDGMATGTFVDVSADKLTVDSMSLPNVEVLVAGAGQNTFVFGDNWGGEINLDTSAATHLELDFRNVIESLKFTFEASGALSIEFNNLIRKIGALNPTAQGTKAKITVTDIDANTTILTGRNHNTIAVKTGAPNFEGTLDGGVGRRPRSAQAAGQLQSRLPQLVKNVLDYSGYFGFVEVNLATVPIPNLDNNVPQLATGFTTDKLKNMTGIVYGNGGPHLLQGTILGDTIKPGIKTIGSAAIMSGLTGSDTYVFGPGLNAGLVIETPDLGPVSSLLDMDTLDFSRTVTDLRFTIGRVTNDSLAGLGAFISKLKVPGTDSYAGRLALLQNYVIVEQVIGDLTFPIALANNIEHIITSRGHSTVVMQDGVEVKGTITAPIPGTITLDYSEYRAPGETKGIDVHIGDAADNRLNQWGRATGVLGGRLDFLLPDRFNVDVPNCEGSTDSQCDVPDANVALDIFDIPDIFDFPPFPDINLPDLPTFPTTFGDWAVKQVRNVIGTPLNDRIEGNSRDNVLDGNGGIDVVDGGGGNDRLSFATSPQGVEFHLDAGEAARALLLAYGLQQDPTDAEIALLPTPTEQSAATAAREVLKDRATKQYSLSTASNSRKTYLESSKIKMRPLKKS
jgi:Ca2+-binding RTX toxin-like protein